MYDAVRDDPLEFGGAIAAGLVGSKAIPRGRVPGASDLGTVARLNGTTSPRGITAGRDYSPAAVQGFNYGQHLRDMIGDPTATMPDPHAHHSVFKRGNGQAQQTLAQEGQQIIRDYDIDPIYGPENLSWAPNRVPGQHSIDALRPLVEELRNAQADGLTRGDILDVLAEHQELSARRR